MQRNCVIPFWNKSSRANHSLAVTLQPFSALHPQTSRAVRSCSQKNGISHWLHQPSDVFLSILRSAVIFHGMVVTHIPSLGSPRSSVFSWKTLEKPLCTIYMGNYFDYEARVSGCGRGELLQPVEAHPPPPRGEDQQWHALSRQPPIQYSSKATNVFNESRMSRMSGAISSSLFEM